MVNLITHALTIWAQLREYLITLLQKPVELYLNTLAIVKYFSNMSVSHVSDVDPGMNLIQMVTGPFFCPHQSLKLWSWGGFHTGLLPPQGSPGSCGLWACLNSPLLLLQPFIKKRSGRCPEIWTAIKTENSIKAYVLLHFALYYTSNFKKDAQRVSGFICIAHEYQRTPLKCLIEMYASS